MRKDEFKAEMLRVDRLWTGKADGDYREVMNKEGKEGRGFAGFAPVIK